MKIFLILIFGLIISSCNYYKFAENRLNAKFKHADLKSNLFVNGDSQMNYWMGGRGDTLLLIHGFGADSRFQWFKQVNTLSKKFTLIIPDLLYFDRSTSSSADFSVDFQSETILNLLQSLNVQNLSIAGVSYGGLVAITICDKNPSMVKSLILCDSPIKFFTQNHYKNALKTYNVNSIQDLLVPDNADQLSVLLKIPYYNPPWVPSFVWNNVYENMFKNQANEKKKLLDYLLQNENYFLTKEYKVDCQTLLIWGKYDSLITPDIGKELIEYIGPNAELVLINKTAHMPNLEKPKYFNKLIMKFLNQNKNP